MEQFPTTIMMGVLAAFKEHVDLQLVLSFQKVTRLAHLEIDVVLAGLGSQANLLELNSMLAAVALTLALLILDLAVVHDAANRWSRVRTDFDQVQSGFGCEPLSVGRGHFAEHVSILTDNFDG